MRLRGYIVSYIIRIVFPNVDRRKLSEEGWQPVIPCNRALPGIIMRELSARVNFKISEKPEGTVADVTTSKWSYVRYDVPSTL
jgi:hypothetical protein